MNQLKEKLQEFWKKVQNSLQICIQKLRIRKKMRKVAGLSVIFLRPFANPQTLVGCHDRPVHCASFYLAQGLGLVMRRASLAMSRFQRQKNWSSRSAMSAVFQN